MYCQKCKFTSFDHYEKCPNCGTNWAETQKELNLAWIKPTESDWFQTNQGQAGNIGAPSVQSSQTQEEKYLLELKQDTAEFESKQAPQKANHIQYEPQEEDEDFVLQETGSIEEESTEEFSLQEDEENQGEEDEDLFVPGLEEMFSSSEDTLAEDYNRKSNLDELINNEDNLDLLSEFDISYAEETESEPEPEPETEASSETDLDEIITPEEDLDFRSKNENQSAQEQSPAEDKSAQQLEGSDDDVNVDFIPELETLELENKEAEPPQDLRSTQQETEQDTEQDSDMFELYLDEEEDTMNLEDIEIELDEDETDEHSKENSEK